jgi:PAT family beta-lactamase induction signal transducer AmpG
VKAHQTSRQPGPWAWIPTLYFASGLPYVVVMTVSVIMYKRLGISNTDIALYTSWLYLPWVIKPFWSPFVDILRTKRAWIIAMQLLIGAGLGGVALTIPTDDFFRNSLAFLWLLAFSSATHDIAADGFYMLGLSKHDQTWFVGIRSTFYRLAMIAGQGLLIMLAGTLEELMQSPGTVSTDLSGSGVESGIAYAWVITFYVMAGMFLLFFAWHKFVLPRPAGDKPKLHDTYADVMRDFSIFRSATGEAGTTFPAGFIRTWWPGPEYRAGGFCLWNDRCVDADPGRLTGSFPGGPARLKTLAIVDGSCD